jgi:hypothetical protein
MATRIEVNVEQGSLLSRNQQEATARRQAWLEQTRLKAAQLEGKEKREDRLEAEGLNADSSSRPSSAIEVGAREERPAADRVLRPYIYFGPKYEPYIQLVSQSTYYSEYDYYFLIDGLKKKGAGSGSGSLQPNRNYYKATAYTWDPLAGVGSVAVSYEIGAGPGGKNSLLVEEFLAAGTAGTTIGEYGPGSDNLLFDNKVTCQGFFRFTDDIRLRFGNVYLKFFQDGVFASTSAFGTGTASLLSFTSLDFASWTHFAFVFEDSNFKFYCNGQLSHSVDIFNAVLPRNLDSVLVYGSPYWATEGATYLFFEMSSIKTVSKLLYTSNFTPPASL